jgi:hypothetical protein
MVGLLPKYHVTCYEREVIKNGKKILGLLGCPYHGEKRTEESDPANLNLTTASTMN